MNLCDFVRYYVEVIQTMLEDSSSTVVIMPAPPGSPAAPSAADTKRMLDSVVTGRAAAAEAMAVCLRVRPDEVVIRTPGESWDITIQRPTACECFQYDDIMYAGIRPESPSYSPGNTGGKRKRPDSKLPLRKSHSRCCRKWEVESIFFNNTITDALRDLIQRASDANRRDLWVCISAECGRVISHRLYKDPETIAREAERFRGRTDAEKALVIRDCGTMDKEHAFRYIPTSETLKDKMPHADFKDLYVYLTGIRYLHGPQLGLPVVEFRNLAFPTAMWRWEVDPDVKQFGGIDMDKFETSMCMPAATYRIGVEPETDGMWVPSRNTTQSPPQNC